MWKDSCGEGSSMSEHWEASPKAATKKTSLRSKRKLPFSENVKKSPDPEALREEILKEVQQVCDSSTSSSSSLTPRRNTPLSERQQIALLCKLSVTDSPSASGEYSQRILVLREYSRFTSLDPCQAVETNRPESREQKRNERGETPLHLACIKGDLSKVRKLLKQGAGVNTADFAGWTALHEACNHGHYKVAKLLIDFGANVNALGLDKYTPLHDAAINDHEDIVKLLLKHGANPLQANVNRRTPLDVARSEKVVELLKAALPKRDYKKTQEVSSPHKDYLRSPEAVENGQSETSPCRPTSALCDLTMRKNSPNTQIHKGADKPTSPRLTLRFQSIRSRDDKSSSSAKVNDISSSQPKYPSYCVTMETKGDVYDFRKDDATVSSTQSVPSESEGALATVKCEAVSSTSGKEVEAAEKETKKSEEPEGSEKSASPEKMDTSESVASKVNGGRTSNDSNKERECVSDVEKEENRRKRRKSNDSNQSKHSTGRGHKSPSNKTSQVDGHGDQRSPKSRKRGSMSSSDTESNPSDAEAHHSTEISLETGNNGAAAAIGPHSPKVPPLKIVIPPGSGSLELETRERNKVSSSKHSLPYVVNTTCAETMDTTSEPVTGSFAMDANKETGKSETPSKSKEENHPPEERFQRVTRSSQRMQAAMSGSGSGNTSSGSSNGSNNGNNNNGSNSNPTPCSSTEATNSNVVTSSTQKTEGSGESSNEDQLQIQTDVHPRKRKLRAREGGNEANSQNPSSAASSSGEDSQQQYQQLNSYQMFLNIRKQVDKRRKGMFIVHPKPPQGYKDYLINRCSYVLEGNAASRLSVPMISPPQSLEGSIKDLFVEQEKERYKLRLQHLIEREKLVLSAEQEVLRVHGRAARAMVNQTVPLSVCSILKDEEIYNVLEDDKDKNVRSRYNGRLFLSWLQDVDDKWEKIKEAMLLRHHNEAESLHAVQKLDWEWKMKELAMCDTKSSPAIDDLHVPMVHVSDDFDLHVSNSCQ